jgi:hypothetical protein
VHANISAEWQNALVHTQAISTRMGAVVAPLKKRQNLQKSKRRAL